MLASPGAMHALQVLLLSWHDRHLHGAPGRCTW